MHAVFHCVCRCRDLQGDHGRKDAGGNPAFLYSKLLRNVSLFFLVSHGGYQGKTQNIKDEPHRLSGKSSVGPDPRYGAGL